MFEVKLTIAAEPALLSVISSIINVFGNTQLGIGPNALQEVQNPAPAETVQAAPKKSRAKKEDPKPEPVAEAQAEEVKTDTEGAPAETQTISLEQLRLQALATRDKSPEHKTKFKELMAEYGVAKISELGDEDRVSFYNALLAL